MQLQRSAEAIARRPLHQEVSRILRQRILHAELPPGTKLNEAKLAGELGVSRTPLREALLTLEREGFLTAAPGRGYSVAPLTGRDVRELFPLMGVLERQALAWAGVPDRRTLSALEEQNARLAEVDEPEAALPLNAEWHRTLLGDCPNGHLLRMIEDVRAKVYRYEYHYYTAGKPRVHTSVRLHRDIIERLARNDLAAACDAVTRHWLTDLDLMLPEMLLRDAR